MSQQQVRAAFDFDAQPGTGELTIRENEVLTVIREGIEGGWMEGKNSKGQIGLFPESYVTRLPPKSSLPPTTAPPPLPPVMSMPPKPMFGGAPPANDPPLPLPARVTSLTSNGSKNFDPWDSPNIPVPPPYLATPANAPISAQSLPPPPAFGASMGSTSQNHNVQDDDFDDDWSDDDEELPVS
uniref:SH3 domain-containing protein n=1 Tax=Acrobeloides nanus TaxID=290746 RepID=A0A914C364_9BILA